MEERVGPPQAGRGRRTIAIVGTGVLVAAGLIGGGFWLGQRGGGQQPGVSGGAGVSPSVTVSPTVPPTTAGPTGTQPAPSRPGTLGFWRKLPAAPVPGGSYGGVWTGRELLVYCSYIGATGTGVGAAYTPAAGTWRRLPRAPGPRLSIEGGEHSVWSGTEMLNFGEVDAAYNPATNAWRRLAGSPVLGPSLTVWTGRQVLMWGGGCCESSNADGAAYDPASNTWQMLPAAPLSGRHAPGAWTGQELVIAGGERLADRTVFGDAAAYNPATRTWRRLPDLPAPRAGATSTWTGTEVLLVGGSRSADEKGADYADGVAYSPATNRWRSLPSMGIARRGHSATWTGRQLLVVGGTTMRNGERTAPPHGVAYDPAGNRWLPMTVSPLRGRYDHVAEWTGSRLLVWAGWPARSSDPVNGFNDGAAFTPYAG